MQPEVLIEKIHHAPGRIVLAVTGGGSGALAALLQCPGASRTVLEATVPYHAAAMNAWLGATPEKYCSQRTARAMAMMGFQRGQIYLAAEVSSESVSGIACTASLASDRVKRGPHRACLALQTLERTVSIHLPLAKGQRSRAEEEQLLSHVILNLVAEACGLSERLPLALREDETPRRHEAEAPLAWRELLLGNRTALGCHALTDHDPAESPRAIFPGAFRPIHHGHRGMALAAARLLGMNVAYEISISNVDKPPLDYLEIQRRLEQFLPDDTVWLTRSATFEAKSEIFPGAVFVVGIDTLQRLIAVRYYDEDQRRRDESLERIRDRGCRFLVFGRALDSGFLTLSQIPLPEPLEGICQEVSPDIFREDISSTEARKGGRWYD
jgi:nicotinamide mononucleotide (NMN) deamidase PncC